MGMEKEHFADKAARRFRKPLIALLLVSGPVFVFSYAKMLQLAATTWSGWIFWPVMVAQVIGFLGIASLIDDHRERR